MRFSKFWIFILILAISIVAFVLISGCSKDENKTENPYEATDEDFDAATGAAIEAAMFSSTVSTANSSTQEEKRGDITWDNGGCPYVTLVGEIGNRVLTISYADTCDFEGLSVSGEVTGAWNYVALEGFTASLDINNFNVEGITTNGNLEATATAAAFVGANLTLNGQITQQYQNNSRTMTVSDLTANGNLNQTPLYPFDDNYTLDGTGTYTDSNGDQYTLDFDNVKAIFLCYFPVSGILTIEGELFTASIDYGDGQCDSAVEITIGNVTKTIDLIDWLCQYE